MWSISHAPAIGAVSVPIYETDSAKQAASIVEEVEPVIAFAGDSVHTQTLEQIRDMHEGLRYVFNFKADGLDAVADFGEGVDDDTLDQVIARTRQDDMLTIVYTSGSTGRPKGCDACPIATSRISCSMATSFLTRCCTSPTG